MVGQRISPRSCKRSLFLLKRLASSISWIEADGCSIWSTLTELASSDNAWLSNHWYKPVTLGTLSKRNKQHNHYQLSISQSQDKILPPTHKILLHRRTVSNVVPHLPFVILVMFRFHLKVNWPLDGTIGHFVADFGWRFTSHHATVLWRGFQISI